MRASEGIVERSKIFKILSKSVHISSALVLIYAKSFNLLGVNLKEYLLNDNFNFLKSYHVLLHSIALSGICRMGKAGKCKINALTEYELVVYIRVFFHCHVFSTYFFLSRLHQIYAVDLTRI